MSKDVAAVAAPLMQKHNVAQSNYEKEKKKDEKEFLIRKNLGRLEKQVEEVVLDNFGSVEQFDSLTVLRSYLFVDHFYKTKTFEASEKF